MSPRRHLVAAATALVVALPLGLAQPAPAAPDQQPMTESTRPADTGGSWEILRTGPQTYRLSWRSPVRLPVTSDRPVIESSGVSLGAASVSADGRTVSVEVRSPQRPDVSRLHVVLSGDRLDVSGDDVQRRRASAPEARFEAPAAEALEEDPAAPGSFDVETSDYQLDPVKLPGMPQPIEMVGHVVEPVDAAATGPRPLVLFLHGRHSYCYTPGDPDGDDWGWPCVAPSKEIPSHLGYDYIQRVLASQGYATVSIRVNGINAQDFALDDGGADARAAIVERHLDHWETLAGAHQVDMSQVVLVGHSRGGEGVDRAALEIPLGAPYTIAGQVLLAPTDFGSQTAAYIPTVTLLPYCDGDVFDLQGQRFTDTARDLAADDTSLKSSVLVMGANHNFFNTEWTPGIAQAPAWDDWGGKGRALCGRANPGRLSAAEQRRVGAAYVSGAVHLFTRDEQQYLTMFDGTDSQVASTGDAVMLSHAIGGGRELRRPGTQAGLSLARGADTQLCTGSYTWSRPTHQQCGRFGDLDGNAPHWPEKGEFAPKRAAFEMGWTASGQSGGLGFDDPLDLSGGQRLELRTIVDPTVGDVAFRVRLADADGDRAVVTPVGGETLAALPSSDQLSKRWAQTVIVDPAAADGVDLTRISQVELVAESPSGRVWVLDVASAPTTLAAVPAERLALISLGRAVVQEGDTPRATARVPFTISGDLKRRASLVVGLNALNESTRASRMPLDLAAGQTEGSITVDYPGNRIDDAARSRIQLAAFAKSGIMTDQYNGRLVVLDDDPTPKVTVRAVRRVVAEGNSAQWKVEIAKRVNYGIPITVTVVRGPGRGARLQVGDVPKKWARREGVSTRQPAKPLFRTTLMGFGAIAPGRTSYVFSVPTRRDRAREGKEQIAVRIRVPMPGGGKTVVRSVYVTD